MTEQERERLIEDIALRLTGQVERLPIHKSKREKPETGEFRTMTLDEIKALRSGSRVWFLSIWGEAITVTVSGMVKTWKRDPQRIEIPVKHGLYDSTRMETAEALNRLLVRMDK